MGDNGAVVLKGLLPPEDVQKARSLYWDWLESLGSGLDRKDPSTWTNRNWPGSALGFTTTHGGGHTDASWFIRAHPRVNQAFATIWGTEDLLTSFDTFICWRPWWDEELMEKWKYQKPYVERLHIDQNPFRKRGRHCVQGMIPLFPVNREVGGLQVIS